MVLEGEEYGERCGILYTESQMSKNIHCGSTGNRKILGKSLLKE